MPISVLVNGHPVSPVAGPAHKQDAPIWSLYLDILDLHADVPLTSVTVSRQSGKTFMITITPVAIAPWVWSVNFTDSDDPVITFTVPGWTMSQFRATRVFRDHLLVWLALDVVDSCSWVFA